MSNQETSKSGKEHRDYKEAVVRWDSYRINQLSFANNLFIVLNLSFLGFFTTQSGFKATGKCYLFVLQFLTFIFLITSFYTGIAAVLNRLKDFRKTSELTKKRKIKFEYEEGIKKNIDIERIKSDILILEREARELGSKTWELFSWQVWTFLIGVFVGVFFIIFEQNF